MITQLLAFLADVAIEPQSRSGGISDAVLLAVVGAFQIIAVAWINQRTKATVVKSEEIQLAKAQEVREAVRTVAHDARDTAQTVQTKLANVTKTTDAKLANITAKTEETHHLVNSAKDSQDNLYGELLRVHAETVRRLAASTGKAECAEAAEAAEQTYKDFQAKKEKDKEAKEEQHGS